MLQTNNESADTVSTPNSMYLPFPSNNEKLIIAKEEELEKKEFEKNIKKLEREALDEIKYNQEMLNDVNTNNKNSLSSIGVNLNDIPITDKNQMLKELQIEKSMQMDEDLNGDEILLEEKSLLNVSSAELDEDDQYHEMSKMKFHTGFEKCEMMLHGLRSTYRLPVRLEIDGLYVDDKHFEYDDIYKIEIGDVSLFHGNVDKGCCMVLLTANGTLQLEVPNQTIRDQWLKYIQEQPRRKSNYTPIENWTVDATTDGQKRNLSSTRIMDATDMFSPKTEKNGDFKRFNFVETMSVQRGYSGNQFYGSGGEQMFYC